ncbi:MAG: sodium-dependent transporter [Nitrosopumilaceae archaeon]
MQAREQWGSHLGFIIACIGSAVGIGNIWRFPYIVGTNGGGAFLVPYVIITVCFGLAFMILEFAVGRRYQTSIITSLAQIKKKFRWAGIFTVLVAFAILSYYLVILGWVIAFLFLMITQSSADFDEFTNSLYPVFTFLVILAINYVVIRKGVTGGIERLNKIGILLLVAMLVPLAIFGMLLPGSEKGLEFYLTPDFSKLSEADIWSTAFGQVFFSLSLGTGILLAYGSYMRGTHSLVKSSAIIIVSNAMVSFVAGLMIFSIVFAFGMNPEEGVALVFQVMPSIFSEMEFGMMIGATFFFLLLIAGLTSSVSIFQVPVSALEDTFGYSKSKSVLIITLLVLAVGLPSALSYSSVELTVFGEAFLDLMDSFFGIYGIAISAVIFVVLVTWFMNKKELLNQVNVGQKIRIPEWIVSVVKFVLPALIIASLLFTFLGI